ncbi:hypothetical protein J2X20_004759 [Pelomonas saccharophila]|uniref:Uncharacterized protein n=1 Tax=Roseateles saccharophilus TaxID=304 RepID=A0ABU1YTA1_ROSSA|nr:hypothetical protein [Roseateles saccharophilus]MDR7272085.1 hypothetical protein [Roseateles saccharophilus]
MADSKSGGLGAFAWAGAAVLAAFVGSTQLVPHAYDSLRPAEKEPAGRIVVPAGELSARLWEDPLSALKRSETERLSRCGKQQTAGALSSCRVEAEITGRSPDDLLQRLDADHDGDRSDVLLLFALLPGADFVGAEEVRRRTRYAVLAGLMAKGYVPDNAEGMRVLALRGLDKSEHVMPYELLAQRVIGRARPDAPATGKLNYRQVALIWVDENELPEPRLDAFARLARRLTGDQGSARSPAVAVLGPSSTDALRRAIRDLRCAADRSLVSEKAASATADPAVCGTKTIAPLDPETKAGYETLARASFYSTGSTAAHYMLEELHEQKLENFVADRFRRLAASPAEKPTRLVRTIGTDNELIKRLVTELQMRLSKDAKRRIVVFAERDSLYAQTLVEELKRRLSDEKHLKFEVEYFLRGLDGATQRGAAEAQAGKPTPAEDPRNIEWPENRNQLDYLRRTSQALRDSQAEPGADAIGAIGIFATDVHDKLLVLQALHEEFSDKVFFTTDIDARFLHPKVQDFSRNLVVASSLPLTFHAAEAANDVDLRAGTPPLRDAYQSSSYLAARQASCRDDGCRDGEYAAMKEVLNAPSVYEIGRSRAVALSGYAAEGQPTGRGVINVVVAVGTGLLTLIALLAWPSTRSMRRVRELLRYEDTQRYGAEIDISALVLTTLQMSVAAFVLANLIEFARPQQVSFVRMLLLGCLGGLAAVLAVLPALVAAGGPAGARRGGGAALDPLHLSVLALLGAIWLVLAWPQGGAAGPCRECEPVAWFQGVSAWPSHLLHLLALVGTLLALDQAWIGVLCARRKDCRWLGQPEPEPSLLKGFSPRALFRHWRDQYSTLAWPIARAASCDAMKLWKQYAERGHPRVRAVRIFFCFLWTIGLGLLFFIGLSEGQIPEVPVRGEEHRQMVKATLYVLLLLLPLLIVVVVDATLLLLCFIRRLNAGRSYYPDETLARFAAGLGSAHDDLWKRKLSARPGDRESAAAERLHSLLDPWVDLQLIARLSQPVARLVIWPFAVLAVIVVARSRLFDNWSLTPPIAGVVCFYVVVLVGLALWVKQAAERARSQALNTMKADRRWLAGSGDAELVVLAGPLDRLISEVEAMRSGAFAPFLEQPLLKALLVPLGGAGGTQLFDILLAR